MSKIRSIVLRTALLASFILSGCSTTKEGIDAGSPYSQPLDIVKGSPTEDLIALFGEPESIEPFGGAPEHVQIWTYTLTKTHTNLIGVDTIEVPFVDPITGEMRMLLETDLQPQMTIIENKIYVFVAYNKVLAWKVVRKKKTDLVD